MSESANIQLQNKSINQPSLQNSLKQEVSLKTCCKSSMTHNLEITQRPMLLCETMHFFLGGGTVFSHNVILQSILYPQQTRNKIGRKTVLIIRRHTKTQVRSLCRPITPFYYSTVLICKQR